MENEKKILKTIKDTSQSVNDAIKEEAAEKQRKHQELTEHISHSLTS